MRSKTPLALMEQLVMVLVFALAAAICVQIFSLSDRLSRQNEAVSQAALLAQNVAEEIKSHGGAFTDVLSGDGWEYTDGLWVQNYDENWTKLEAGTMCVPEYRIEVSMTDADIS